MNYLYNILNVGVATFILLLPNHLHAQAPKYSNEFLKIGVGARAHGMGASVVSSMDQVESTFWNPAGLSQVQGPLEIAAMHSEWFAGIAQYDYIGIAKTLNTQNHSVLGISLIRMGIDNIPYTINLIEPDGSFNYDNVSSFSAADYGIFGSYAQGLRIPNLFVGGSLKIVHRSVGSFGSAWGFGADLGVQYRPGNWRFGLMARDLTTTFNSWSFNLTNTEKEVFLLTGNEIPTGSTEITLPSFILGSAYNWQLGKSLDLLLEFDAEITTDGQRNTLISSSALNVDPRLGLELGYNNNVFLRAGLNNVQRQNFDDDPSWSVQPNFGLGLRFGRFTVDYALSRLSVQDEAIFSHIISASLRFKSRKKPVE
ncbi:MAG: PorV/PorQ family protein [Saprospiraceae bacterium]